MIGVGITTHNRRALALATIDHWRALLPEGARLVVVDDGSDEPLPGADHRFEIPAGVARAKNRCLALLDGCEHIFLADDDVWPTSPDWWRPYAAAPVPHLMHLWRGTVLHNDGALIARSHPQGCLLYVRRNALDRVGGMRPEFGRYGREHLEWSQRIHAAGLTPWPYMGVAGTSDIWHAMDEAHEAPSTMRGERMVRDRRNRAIHARFKGSTDFIDFHEEENPVSTLPDVAWFVHETDNEMLRYSIRSVVERAAGKYRRLWIVGQMPEWLTGVGFIPVDEPTPPEKFASIRAKMTALAHDRRVTRNVVVINDDTFAVRDVESWEPTHMGPTSRFLERNFRPRNSWFEALRDTAAWVGGDPLCYAGHVALMYDRTALREALANYPAKQRLLDCGLYPIAGAGGEGTWALNAKCGPADEAKADDPQMPGWLSLNDASWSGPLGKRVRAMFPEPTKYEVG